MSRFKNRTADAPRRRFAEQARASRKQLARGRQQSAFGGNNYTRKNLIAAAATTAATAAAARPAAAQSVRSDSCRCRPSPTRLAV